MAEGASFEAVVDGADGFAEGKIDGAINHDGAEEAGGDPVDEAVFFHGRSGLVSEWFGFHEPGDEDDEGGHGPSDEAQGANGGRRGG